MQCPCPFAHVARQTGTLGSLSRPSFSSEKQPRDLFIFLLFYCSSGELGNVLGFVGLPKTPLVLFDVFDGLNPLGIFSKPASAYFALFVLTLLHMEMAEERWAAEDMEASEGGCREGEGHPCGFPGAGRGPVPRSHFPLSFPHIHTHIYTTSEAKSQVIVNQNPCLTQLW